MAAGPRIQNSSACHSSFLHNHLTQLGHVHPSRTHTPLPVAWQARSPTSRSKLRARTREAIMHTFNLRPRVPLSRNRSYFHSTFLSLGFILYYECFKIFITMKTSFTSLPPFCLLTLELIFSPLWKSQDLK